jgi:hypothetical protein
MNAEQLVEKVRTIFDRKLTTARERRATILSQNSAAHSDFADRRITQTELEHYIEKLSPQFDAADRALAVLSRKVGRDDVAPIMRTWLTERTSRLEALQQQAADVNAEIVLAEKAISATGVQTGIGTCRLTEVSDLPLVIANYRHRVGVALAPRSEPRPVQAPNLNYEPRLSTVVS